MIFPRQSGGNSNIRQEETPSGKPEIYYTGGIRKSQARLFFQNDAGAAGRRFSSRRFRPRFGIPLKLKKLFFAPFSDLANKTVPRYAIDRNE
jgi:hypothetical protein